MDSIYREVVNKYIISKTNSWVGNNL